MKTTNVDLPSNGPDLGAVLRRRLMTARRKNPRFSLRAFAAKVGVHHSTLSQVLRGKRALTPAQTVTVARHLAIAVPPVRPRPRALAPKPVAGVRTRSFSPDTFELLAHWLHSAILELTHVTGFRADSRWLSRILNAPVSDVNVALQRLLRLRLLKMTAHNRWTDVSKDLHLRPTRMSESLTRRVKRQAHDAGVNAIETGASERQVFHDIVLAIDRTQLDAIRGLAERFISNVRIIADSGPKNDVYRVSVTAFPLTTLQNADEDARE